MQHLSDNMLVRNVFCYNIFMVIGYCYYRQVSLKTIVIVLAVAISILIGLLLETNVSFTPMQEHKFPPDSLFVLYNIIVLCLLSLIFCKVKIPQNKLVNLWNERGYTLYLYQSIVYFGMFGLYLAVISKIGNHLLENMICSTMMFVLSTVVSCVVYPLERKITSFNWYEK